MKSRINELCGKTQFINTSKLAFTLAEVLITLGIIGVVAAMAIPTLLTNYQKKMYETRLKKTYAQVIHAMKMVSKEYDGNGMDAWTCNDVPSGVLGSNGRCFYLAMQEIPGTVIYPQQSVYEHVACYNGKEYKSYQLKNGSIPVNGKMLSTVSSSALLPSGACIIWNSASWAGDARGSLYIDVDGPYSGPNTLGKDLFAFDYITPNSGAAYGDGLRIYPQGLPRNSYEAHRDRSELITNCKKYGGYCSGLFFEDGLKMSNDYPWNYKQ
jgi:prepilin-type N-terminal cleavage/methylation domain-containing protein